MATRHSARPRNEHVDELKKHSGVRTRENAEPTPALQTQSPIDELSPELLTLLRRVQDAGRAGISTQEIGQYSLERALEQALAEHLVQRAGGGRWILTEDGNQLLSVAIEGPRPTQVAVTSDTRLLIRKFAAATRASVPEAVATAFRALRPEAYARIEALSDALGYTPEQVLDIMSAWFLQAWETGEPPFVGDWAPEAVARRKRADAATKG